MSWSGAAHGRVTMDAEEAIERFLGKSLKTMSDILHEDYGLQVDDRFLEAMRHDLYQRFETELQPVAGIAETLDRLPIARCVASSSQMERIRLSLTITGLIGKLEPHLFSATMVRNGKPAPDLFLHAAQEMGTPPSACIVIEDSPAGIQAAKAAGMRVFAFAGASHARTQRHLAALTALEPDACLTTCANSSILSRGNEGRSTEDRRGGTAGQGGERGLAVVASGGGVIEGAAGHGRRTPSRGDAGRQRGTVCLRSRGSVCAWRAKTPSGLRSPQGGARGARLPKAGSERSAD